MKPFMRGLGELQLVELATISPDPGWDGRDMLVSALLGVDKRAPLAATALAFQQGAAVDGLLDAVVVTTVSERMLRYDEAAVRASMLDTSGAFIVQAHAIKTSRAAWEESVCIGSVLPLDAAWRFMHAPRLDRFVASAVQQSIDFLSGRVARD